MASFPPVEESPGSFPRQVSIACYTDEYYSGVFTLAIAAVSFWAVGLVIVNGVFLVCARAANLVSVPLSRLVLL